MRRLEDLEVVRVLELCGEIAAVQPKCSMALLPADCREQAIWVAWREALMSRTKVLAELSEILNR